MAKIDRETLVEEREILISTLLEARRYADGVEFELSTICPTRRQTELLVSALTEATLRADHDAGGAVAMREAAVKVALLFAENLKGNPTPSGEAVARAIAAQIRALDSQEGS